MTVKPVAHQQLGQSQPLSCGPQAAARQPSGALGVKMGITLFHAPI
jgi:hypothetical protein